jgi:hypothetical protein
MNESNRAGCESVKGAHLNSNIPVTPEPLEVAFEELPVLNASEILRPEILAGTQRAPAIISLMTWRPRACNGPMPLPGRNHMPLSLSRQ